MKVFSDAGMNYTLKDFRYEVQVGYRTITCKVIERKQSFFEKRNRCIFKRIRTITFGEGQVNYGCDWNKQGIDERFQKLLSSLEDFEYDTCKNIEMCRVVAVLGKLNI